MYPTRAVRHAAWDTLDLLFPVSGLLVFGDCNELLSMIWPYVKHGQS